MESDDTILLKNKTFEVVDNILDKELVNYELINDNTIKVSLLSKKHFTISIYENNDNVQIKIIPKTDNLNARNVTVHTVNENSTKRIAVSIKKMIVDIEQKRLNDVYGLELSNSTTNNNELKLKQLLTSYPSFTYSKMLDRVMFNGSYYTYEIIDGTLYINLIVDKKSKLIRIDSANIILNANRNS